ncbi:MAG: phosphatidate cytidylyltransferase [Dysgonamonadaceae bacterium]|jgi:phosphatidate cytidylyltransferase|nr:phosphatidate cytidylyltransferase [Dysgonamonadaceae bacterium]
MKNLISRALTGTVYVILITFCILYNKWTYCALFTVISIACTTEFFVLLAKHGNNIRRHRLFGIAGAIYVLLPLSLLIYSVFTSPDFKHTSRFVMSLFIFLWVFDSTAYLVGSKFGRHRLCERISPKKSWEGFCGGLFFTILTAFILGSIDFADIPPVHWIIFAVLTVISGTAGDLIESKFKRIIGVKDSGYALPGHGGFLDRFDSLLLTAYLIIIFLFI